MVLNVAFFIEKNAGLEVSPENLNGTEDRSLVSRGGRAILRLFSSLCLQKPEDLEISLFLGQYDGKALSKQSITGSLLILECCQNR